MKYCPNCGAACEDHVMFCSKCGTQLAGGNPTQGSTSGNSQYTYTTNNTYNVNYNAPVGNSNGIVPRNIAVAVILSIVTCGIYGIYWMIKLNDEVNQLSGEPGATSGAMVFVLSLVTCSIYSWYWLYKMGERCDRIKGSNSSSGIVYLILGIFGLGIVAYCLMQDTINKAV